MFSSRSQPQPAKKPAPAKVPASESAEIAASYHATRTGGDYFEFVRVGPDRLLLALLDIAGEVSDTMPIAASVQELLHSRAPELFGREDVNEADAIAELVLLMNRTILSASKNNVCHTPAFVACYNESIGLLTYVNAGHTPGLLKLADSVDLLSANGLPLGLFSHSTHDAQMAVIPPGGTVLLVSRGLVEIRSGREEFTLERLQEYLRSQPTASAAKACEDLLQHVSRFSESVGGLGKILKFSGTGGIRNDVTAVALVRQAAANAASAS